MRTRQPFAYVIMTEGITPSEASWLRIRVVETLLHTVYVYICTPSILTELCLPEDYHRNHHIGLHQIRCVPLGLGAAIGSAGQTHHKGSPVLAQQEGSAYGNTAARLDESTIHDFPYLAAKWPVARAEATVGSEEGRDDSGNPVHIAGEGAIGTETETETVVGFGVEVEFGAVEPAGDTKKASVGSAQESFVG